MMSLARSRTRFGPWTRRCTSRTAADGGCIAPCGLVGLDEPPAQRDGTKHQLLDGSWSDEKRWRYPDLVARRPCAMLGVNMFVIFVIVGIVGAAGCASSAIRRTAAVQETSALSWRPSG